MFNPKRTIPSLGVITLTLAGCVPPPPPPPPPVKEEVVKGISAFCMKAVQCFPPGTMAGCVAYYTEYYANLGQYYAVEGDCASLLGSYLNCLADLACDELEMTDNDCEAQHNDDIIATCGFPER